MKANIIGLKQLLPLSFIPSLFVRSSGKKNFPGIEQLYKDLIHSMQKIRTNYGRGYNRLSDLYKLRNCEKICSVETKKGTCQIQFTGMIELIDTIYSYGSHGYRTYYITNKVGQTYYRGEVKKGTVLPITGKAEYKLTKNGWKYEGHKVSMTNALAPRF